jgi:hypothetical protein
MSATAPASQETELRQELTIVQQATGIKITDRDSYGEACTLLVTKIMPFRKRWKEYWAPLTKAAHEAHKAVLAKFNDGDEPAAKAEAIVKSEIGRWEREQEAIRLEAQRKAQQEAEEHERAQKLADAVFAEEAGATAEEVEAIATAPVLAVAEPVALTFERASGISKRDNWKLRVIDLKALCKAIGAGKVPVNYVLPNETVLNSRARADRETMQVPGCTAVNEPIITGRSR